MGNSVARRTVAIVIGSAELGSAIAIQLDRAGMAVVLCDEVDPGCLRRGMSFSDAWYVGAAFLAGSRAVFCSNAKSIPAVIANRGPIAATTWSWHGLAKIVAPVVIIDARSEHVGPPPRLRALVPEGTLTIGATPWHSAGENAHVAIWPWPTKYADFHSLERRVAWDPLSQDPHRCGVRAPDSGRFCTARNIGDYVLPGSPIGVAGRSLIAAPVAGVLSGLLAPGSRVKPHTVVAEVDTRGHTASCFSVAKWCESVAGNIASMVTACEDRAVA